MFAALPARDQVGAHVGGLEVFHKLPVAVVDCVCVCVKERERERERESPYIVMFVDSHD